MNSVKLLHDLGNLLLDTETSDVVLLCQGEQIRAHKLILSARSPVFKAMLQSQMLESTKGEIRIEDAEKDVLKEMLSYIYKIDIDVNFVKFKELLVLADKYQVDDLLKYCEEQIIKSLNNENALEVGIFAETHNANNLLEECIHFILNNVPHSLSKDWVEKIEGSPKMMVKMIKYFLGTHPIDSIIYEIKRKAELHASFFVFDAGKPIAIAFQVDANVQLHGIGMYGSKDADYIYDVKFKIMDDGNHCLFEETKQYKSNGTDTPIKLTFSRTVQIEAEKKYHIVAEG